jgi:hypothetical protein
MTLLEVAFLCGTALAGVANKQLKLTTTPDAAGAVGGEEDCIVSPLCVFHPWPVSARRNKLKADHKTKVFSESVDRMVVA